MFSSAIQVKNLLDPMLSNSLFKAITALLAPMKLQETRSTPKEAILRSLEPAKVVHSRFRRR